MLDKDLQEEIVRVRELMQKRYLRQKEHINKSENILMIGNHNIKRKKLEAFLIGIGKIYPNKHFTFLNIHDRKNGNYIHTYNLTDKLTLIECFMDDFEDVNAEKPWHGNEELWDKIIPEIKVKNKFE